MRGVEIGMKIWRRRWWEWFRWIGVAENGREMEENGRWMDGEVGNL